MRVLSALKEKRFNFTNYFQLFSSTRQLSKSLTDILLTMPKEPTHAITMKAQRLKIKEKGQKYPPGNVVLQVLGSGAKGAPRSLYLFTDQSRYLFNCGEGTQRLAHEHKMKLSKLEHIFITRGTWENVGGLPGVILTIQDVGVPEITLHGPPGIDQIFTATKRFVVLKNLTIKSASSRPDHKFEDNAITVNYIPIYREQSDESDNNRGSEDSSDDDIDYYDHAVGNNRIANEAPNDIFPNQQGNELRPDKRCVMCFAVRLQPRPGSLCLDKCVEAGVPPGPLLGRLKAGEDVVLVNGTVVRSADVTMAADPGPIFLVVECPDESFLDPLVNEPSFEKYQLVQTKDDKMPVLIVHFTPTHILQTEKYMKWMDKFSLSTFHLILNEDNTCMGSTSVHRIQHKLNLLDSSIFPLLEDDITTKESSGTTPNSECSSEIPVQPNGSSPLERNFNISKARTFCNFSLRPKKTLDNRLKVVSEPDEYKEEVMKIDGFSMELTKLASTAESSSAVTICDHPKVTFLGTGSCIPNKTRNTSGILLDISEEKCMLLDCGEGTYGQLVRLYGPKYVDSVLKNMKAIYISHLHADHHIGLIGVLKGLAKAGNDGVVYLIAPKQIMFWLNFYDKQFEPILRRVQLIPNQAIQFKDYNLDERTSKMVLTDLEMERIETCYVKHCPNAFGVSLKHRDGWKIAYSGDTMPCDDFVELGRDCDLLIHEATMEDELKEEAVIKLHSTTSEAIDVGKKMGAKFTMLTHFSQRYAKLPRLGESGSFGDNVGIAFDNMRVRLSDLSKLGNFNPALLLMFQEDVDELETKAFKRQMKQERETKKKQKMLAD